MAFSKIIFNGDTLMDVTQDTVEASNLLAGFTATARNGQKIIVRIIIKIRILFAKKNE